MSHRFLLYGANGYTGALIAREAAARGLRPVLAGRSAAAVGELARSLHLEHRITPLDDAAALDGALEGMPFVLHCAGPFSRTSRLMVDACLRTGAHYLDITGELGVFEALARRHGEAQAQGVMLLPGVGFDVVPSDCLAAHLKARLPLATHLSLALRMSGRTSRGTALSALEHIDQGGAVRRDGAITRVPAGYRTRDIDFGDGPTRAVTIPWGDVSTAYYSTGIPNIEVYLAAPTPLRAGLRATRYIGWLLGSRPARGFLQARIRAGAPGPSDKERARGRSELWGEVLDQGGHRHVSRLRGPEGYTFTVHTALAAAERVLAGGAKPGFQTPSLAFGADFVLGIPGVELFDVA